ncbi:GNAT family N-acetyltransferase [Vibrio amylolyticus]|uniref:GNAT family N-acetyltransferase n=1 Tax=Vibrio amylolyticus TaxID=2847292 RepID=UPI00354C6271
MDISIATEHDSEAISKLFREVSNVDILPHFNEQGKEQYESSVLPDLTTTFNKERFVTLKVMSSGNLLGFGAIRDKNYITHIFVSKEAQGLGVGTQLLNALLASTNNDNISLRSSVNAVDFYQSNGFKATSDESNFNGIRFVPMALSR